ncbi:MAG: hypothetical protein AAB561_02075 [Patescibacteria group bacterium]
MNFSLIDAVKTALPAALSYWWVYLPVILALILWEEWKDYRQDTYISSMEWVLLEITPPPEVQRSPKIAENMFAGFHGIYSKSLIWKKQFFGGKVPDWFSFEIVSNAGEIKFYVRSTKENRNLVESIIFAQYPDAEIKEAEDYVNQMPESLTGSDYDIFGTELIFTKEDAYPIKTYQFFEEDSGKDEFVRSDPLAPLAEVMSALGPGEHLWLQLVARPTGADWTKDAQKIVDKIIGKEAKKQPSSGQKIVGGIDEALSGLGLLPNAGEAKEEKKDKAEFNVQKLTPVQKSVLEQIETKMAKLAFKAGHRFMYVARKDAFNKSRVPTVIGMFKQLYFNNMNSFKPNGDITTKDDGALKWLFPSDTGFFSEERTMRKKRKIWKEYKKRKFVKKVNILNIEEMATLWHLPGLAIRAPLFPRVEASKGQPPSGLPTR